MTIADASPGQRFPLFRQEVGLLLLGIGTGIALLVRAGVRHAAFLEVGIATLAYALALSLLRSPKVQLRRFRVATACGYALWFYVAIARIVPALGLTPRDDTLLALDRALFGETPAIAWQSYATPWLTEGMSACYLSYHFYLVLALTHAFWTSAESAEGLGRPVCIAFALGLLGYLLVPAVGPWHAYPERFPAAMTGGWLTGLNGTLVQRGSSVYDAFPSLHVLVTCVILEHDWRNVRRRFWFMLAPAAGLACSTIYLRYHYVIDLLAGLTLFLVVRSLSFTSPCTRHPPSIPPP